MPTSRVKPRPKRREQSIVWNNYAEHGPTWCVLCGCVMGPAQAAFRAHEEFHRLVCEVRRGKGRKP